MKLRLVPGCFPGCYHKGRSIITFLEFFPDGNEESCINFYLNRVLVLVAQFDDGWWIIPEFYDEENLIEDQGPFKTHEEAVMFLMLTKDY